MDDIEPPEMELYVKVILPKDENEKIKTLEKYLKQVIIVNLNPDIKENYMRGLLYQSYKTKNFALTYQEKFDTIHQRINLSQLEEFFVMKNLI